MVTVTFFRWRCFLLAFLMLVPAKLLYGVDGKEPVIIKEIDSIKEAAVIFDQAPQDAFFVFDVDFTLFQTIDPFLQSRYQNNIKKQLDFFADFAKDKPNPIEHKVLLFSKYLLNDGVQPVEQEFIDKILMLQKKGIKCIVLTAMSSGRFGVIENMQEWRYQQLLSIGLDFSQSFGLQEIIFDELQKTQPAAVKYKAEMKKDPSPALFYKGIIASSCFSKGAALRAFLGVVNWRPAHVYFFDDMPQQVVVVAQEMQKMGIACDGFIYKAATVNRPTNDFDVKLVQTQRALIAQRDDYVSADEAKGFLSH